MGPSALRLAFSNGQRTYFHQFRPCARCRATASPSTMPGLPLWRRAGFAQSSRANVKKYTEDHEWIEVADDGRTGKIGISTYASSQLGDVVFVELPELEQHVSAGDAIGAVESVKSASDIMSPATGVITRRNDKLTETPALLNKSAEADGWIAEMTIEDNAELGKLMDQEAYARLIGEEK
ncbi:MAG: glycine cleavage system H-protein subunit [Lichina confinis]|nr:MAG: glycine cleavage system H-protein subunit [Lichina confinis]